MPRVPQDVTEAELSLLDRLWETGPATIRRLTDEIYPAGGASHYATVQKLLERLESKACVRRQRQNNVNVYVAVIGRNELIGRRLKAIADRLCGGSLTPLLSHLVESHPLSESDRRSLRALIERLDQQHRRPRRR